MMREDVEVGSYQTRPKQRTTAERDDMVAAAVKGILWRIPKFSEREFDSFDEFEREFAYYAALYNAGYRRRQSVTIQQKNKKLRQTFQREQAEAERKGLEWTKTLEVYPAEMKYFKVVYECVHASYQQKRGDNIRNQKATRYTNCSARVTAKWKLLSGGKRVVVAHQQNSEHNHTCSESIYLAYITNSVVEDEKLFARIEAQISVGGNPRDIRAQATATLGAPFTRTMYNNLKHYQLGGGLAAVNLEEQVERLARIPGSRCTLVLDTDGTVVGIISQTGIQAQYFQLCGDTMVLDWTHNTNNLGLYLGTMMATSPTGKGVPVLEFLCLSQGKEIMKTVLEDFLENITTPQQTTKLSKKPVRISTSGSSPNESTRRRRL